MLVLKGHTKSIQALAYTPDGRYLVSAGDDATILIWDVRTGKQSALEGHTEGILSLSISGDGALLASGGHDRQVRTWTLKERWTLKQQTLLMEFEPFNATVNAVAYSPDGNFLASGADRTLSLTLRVLNYNSREAYVRGGGDTVPHPVWSLAFSPDSAVLAIGWGSGIVELTEAKAGDTISELPHVSGVTALAFSPDGKTLATLSSNVLTLWDVQTGQRRRTLQEHTGRTWAIAWSPDGRSIATGGWDSTVRLWDPDTGVVRGRFDWQLGKRINAVAFSPDGMTAAVAGDAPDIVIWDIDDV